MRAVGRLTRDVVLLLFGKYGQYVVTLLTTPVVARVLGVEGIGLLAVAMAAYFIGSAMVDFGLTHLLAPTAAVERSLGRLRGDYLALRLVTLSVLGVALTAALISGNQLVVLVALGLCAGGLSSAGEDWILIGLGRYGRLALAQSITRLAYLAGVIAGVLLVPLPHVVLAVSIATNLLASLLTWWMSSRLVPPIERPNVARVARLVRRGAVAFGSRLLIVGYSLGAPLLYATALPGSALGLFSSGERVVRAAQSVNDALGVALLPRFARADAGGAGLWQRVPAAVVGALLSGCLLATVLWIMAPWVIAILYGPAFVAAVPVLRLLVLVIPAAAISSVLLTSVVYVVGDSWGVLLCSVVGLAGVAVTVGFAFAWPAASTIATGTVIVEACVMGAALARAAVLYRRSIRHPREREGSTVANA